MGEFEEILKIRIELSKEKLKSKSEMLRRTMDILIKRIDNNNIHTINSLGEVQGLGREVDIHCMELKTLLDSLESYQSFKSLK